LGKIIYSPTHRYKFSFSYFQLCNAKTRFSSPAQTGARSRREIGDLSKINYISVA